MRTQRNILRKSQNPNIEKSASYIRKCNTFLRMLSVFADFWEASARTENYWRPCYKSRVNLVIVWAKYLAALILGLVLLAGLIIVLFVALTAPRLPSMDALTDYRPKVPLRVFSSDGLLLGEFGEERRSVVKLPQVPKALQNAILAAEDANFYDHGGIDWRGVIRSAYVNATSGSVQGGASTITMQVARNFFLSREQTMLRKANEALLAFKIERNLTKDQILEIYINHIFLGERAYGFGEAALAYYGRTLNELTLAETAMLAGVPKAPSAYNPIVNPQRAKLRQQYVLRRMLELEMITKAEHDAAMAQKLVHQRVRREASKTATYITEMVRKQVFDLYGETAYSLGLNVTTTVLSAEQDAAYAAVRKGVLDYDRRHGYRGPEGYITLPAPGTARDEAVEAAVEKAGDRDDLLAAVVIDAKPTRVVVARADKEMITIEGEGLRFVRRALSDQAPAAERIRAGAIVRILDGGNGAFRLVQRPQVEAALASLDPQTGAIRALVGGFDFSNTQFNHATQAQRQPGSSMKPFLYSAAIEKGVTASTVVDDFPITIPASKTGSDDWEPKNSDDKYDGPMTVRQGLARSRNTVSVRLIQKIGVQYAHDYMMKFGFDPKANPAVYALALGAGAASPLQMAVAYGVFANGGMRVKPYLITRITDQRGVEVYATPAPSASEHEQIIDARNAFIMSNLLKESIRSGTATRAQSLKRQDLAGKTGTTNDAVDAWFGGFNTKVVAVAWLGYSTPKSLGERETGGGAALPIWINYMQTALKGEPASNLKRPDGLSAVRIGGTPKPLPADAPPDAAAEMEGGYTEYYYNEYPAGSGITYIGGDYTPPPIAPTIDPLPTAPTEPAKP
jgi:penicillin-binding protein 1A